MLLAQCSMWLNPWLVNSCMNGKEMFLFSPKIQCISSGDEGIRSKNSSKKEKVN